MECEGGCGGGGSGEALVEILELESADTDRLMALSQVMESEVGKDSRGGTGTESAG